MDRMQFILLVAEPIIGCMQVYALNASCDVLTAGRKRSYASHDSPPWTILCITACLLSITLAMTRIKGVYRTHASPLPACDTHISVLARPRSVGTAHAGKVEFIPYLRHHCTGLHVEMLRRGRAALFYS